jgi:hypothetical protein
LLKDRGKLLGWLLNQRNLPISPLVRLTLRVPFRTYTLLQQQPLSSHFERILYAFVDSANSFVDIICEASAPVNTCLGHLKDKKLARQITGIKKELSAALEGTRYLTSICKKGQLRQIKFFINYYGEKRSHFT